MLSKQRTKHHCSQSTAPCRAPCSAREAKPNRASSLLLRLRRASLARVHLVMLCLDRSVCACARLYCVASLAVISILVEKGVALECERTARPHALCGNEVVNKTKATP